MDSQEPSGRKQATKEGMEAGAAACFLHGKAECLGEREGWEEEVRASGCSGMNFKAQYVTGRGKHSFVSSRLGRVG